MWAKRPERAAGWLRTYYPASKDLVLMVVDMAATTLLGELADELWDYQIAPVSDTALVESVHDKWSFAGHMRRLGLAHPTTELIDQRSDLDALDLAFPQIVKPLADSSGRGITRVDSEHALRQRIESEPLPVIVQQFIEGRDIDISILADHGRIVAWAVQSWNPQTRRLEFFEDRRLYDVCAEFVADTGYHGLGHMDMRIDTATDQLYAIEFNPRSWGSINYAAWAGVNFPALAVRMAMGETLDTQPHPKPCAVPMPNKKLLVKQALTGQLLFSTPATDPHRTALGDPMPAIRARVRRLHRRLKGERLRGSMFESPTAAKM